MGFLDKCRKLCSCLRCEPPVRQKIVPDSEAEGGGNQEACRELQRQAECIVAEAIKRASEIIAREGEEEQGGGEEEEGLASTQL